MKLAIVIPTLGAVYRPTLKNLLNALANQVNGDDNVLVVSDTPFHDDPTWMLVKDTPFPDNAFVHYWHTGVGAPLGHWGHAARNRVLDYNLLTGSTHLWTIDDDDMILPGALDLIRDSCCDVPVIFKMRFGPGSHANGVVIHRGRGLMLGEVGTPMIVAPLCGARFGRRYCGDFDYATNLVLKLGDPIYRDEVIVDVRPEVR
jgi:glycosyltransferase involved in cell wall biosynthesis